jgi:hypothetical protein
MRSAACALALALLSTAGTDLRAQSIVLYANDFEKPNVPVEIDYGNSLDTRGIQLPYGTPGFTFNQQFTVGAVSHADQGMHHSDPSGKGGAYSLGMLSTAQDDKLALMFDRQGTHVGQRRPRPVGSHVDAAPNPAARQDEEVDPSSRAPSRRGSSSDGERR